MGKGVTVPGRNVKSWLAKHEPQVDSVYKDYKQVVADQSQRVQDNNHLIHEIIN